MQKIISNNRIEYTARFQGLLPVQWRLYQVQSWDVAKQQQEQSWVWEHPANLSKWRKDGKIKAGAAEMMVILQHEY